MKVAEYKQIDERIEEYTVNISAEYDEKGNCITKEHKEIHTRIVPVMGTVYRDMTEEEIAESERRINTAPMENPTQLDRIEAQIMYTALMTDTLIEED